MRQPIPELKDYLADLPTTEAKELFARRCGTTLPYLRLVAGGHKEGGEALAINIDRETGGRVPCERIRPDVDFAYLRGTAPPEIAREARPIGDT
jgi:DNA-binding transcriptional regulator YdaS (Cro superfamily)